jgi:tight adherence protein B
MIVSPIILLSAGLLILTGFGFSGLLVSRAQAVEKRLRLRHEAVLQPHIRAQPINIHLFASSPESNASAKAWLASWFGIDLERPDICPLPWWAVVAGSLVAAQVESTAAAHVLGPVAWFGFPVTCILASRTVFGTCKTKRRTKLLIQFPDALMMMVRSVRVGVPVTQAIHIIAREQPHPTSIEFARLGSALSIGEPLDTAILEMARHAGLAEYRFFATALTLQSKAGGALSGTLENLADMIRRRVGVKERAHALASEARMSIYVLTGLPVLVGGAMAFLNPQYIGVLITDPLGNKLLITAIMLLGSGIAAMKFIVKQSTT